MHKSSYLAIDSLILLPEILHPIKTTPITLSVEEFFLDSVYSGIARRVRIWECIGVHAFLPGGQIGFSFFVNIVANSRANVVLLSHNVDLDNSFQKNIWAKVHHFRFSRYGTPKKFF